MAERLEITGGAGPEEAAAIAAVVAAIEAEEKAALATQRTPIHRSQWIEAGRARDHLSPRRDHAAPRPADAEGRQPGRAPAAGDAG